MLDLAAFILGIVTLLAIVFGCMGFAYLISEVISIWRQP